MLKTSTVVDTSFLQLLLAVCLSCAHYSFRDKGLCPLGASILLRCGREAQTMAGVAWGGVAGETAQGTRFVCVCFPFEAESQIFKSWTL